MNQTLPQDQRETVRDPIDVAVGGGLYGLGAALGLVRSRRTVVVIDAGRPRNAPAAHWHGIGCSAGLMQAACLRRNGVRSGAPRSLLLVVVPFWGRHDAGRKQAQPLEGLRDLEPAAQPAGHFAACARLVHRRSADVQNLPGAHLAGQVGDCPAAETVVHDDGDP